MTVNVCVAGIGANGLKHLEGIASIDGMHVAAVVDADVGKAEAVAARFGVASVEPNLGLALKRTDIDAVILCTPTPMHAEQGLACLRAGKHVQIEIPIADNLADVEALLHEQKRSGLIGMAGHTRRFNPSHQWVRQRILAGELNIQQMDVQTYFMRRTNINALGEPRGWTDHLLWHHACHTVDLFQYQTGDAATRINAMQGQVHPELGIAMDMSIQLKAKSGALCTLSLSFNNDGPIGTAFRYICDSGTYLVNYDDLFDGAGNRIDVSGIAVSVNGFELQDRAFLAAVESGTDPESSFERVMPAYATLDRAEKLLNRPVRLGVVGLGRAFTLLLPTFVKDRRVKLVAATDTLEAARTQFTADFGAPAYASIEQLCASSEVDAVYIATPHQLHAEHVCLAASYGKHILVEKPMAITLDECTRMIDAARAANVHLIIGPSHSFDLPYRRAREMIESGKFGEVRMITAQDFTDFLYRPRRPEELNTAEGGGVVHSQAAHQMDVVRLLGGGLVRSLRAYTGAWDSSRPTEGAYSALLSFENGAFCTATYSGYGHYDSSELLDWIGESGQHIDAANYGVARRRLRGVGSLREEARLKALRNYSGALSAQVLSQPAPVAHPNFGEVIVSCERADLRPTARGVAIYGDDERQFETVPVPDVPRSELIDELYAAVIEDRELLHSGEWARATTETCLAILESARTAKDCMMKYQLAV